MRPGGDFWRQIRMSSEVGVYVISVDSELVLSVLRLRFSAEDGFRRKLRFSVWICVDESCVYSYVKPPIMPPSTGPIQYT